MLPATGKSRIKTRRYSRGGLSGAMMVAGPPSLHQGAHGRPNAVVRSARERRAISDDVVNFGPEANPTDRGIRLANLGLSVFMLEDAWGSGCRNVSVPITVPVRV